MLLIHPSQEWAQAGETVSTATGCPGIGKKRFYRFAAYNCHATNLKRPGFYGCLWLAPNTTVRLSYIVSRWCQRHCRTLKSKPHCHCHSSSSCTRRRLQIPHSRRFGAARPRDSQSRATGRIGAVRAQQPYADAA
ncbi:hypothetical protein BAUCODRAFT_438056 [Baudoinia panamericana UAMH 10762]|uniref:Uncharacterized protein n=1 Tax=Baudoinia panamericana (strain UAMH 10762) TaxID=717646 RepID=M2LRM3_BAUPA|nr:uncharacterized protein BAUCODRAFT_438056 [Baudoinia panamericana UAMH 10762]EMC97102.1 hypothetical protein BAUCODRAFT_438056 [Baudoinia panamericana UAMH 10762]